MATNSEHLAFTASRKKGLPGRGWAPLIPVTDDSMDTIPRFSAGRDPRQPSVWGRTELSLFTEPCSSQPDEACAEGAGSHIRIRAVAARPLAIPQGIYALPGS